jgi:hypothetical protein
MCAGLVLIARTPALSRALLLASVTGTVTVNRELSARRR